MSFVLCVWGYLWYIQTLANSFFSWQSFYVLGPHLTVLRGYSWFCAEKRSLMMLEGTYRCWGFEPGLHLWQPAIAKSSAWLSVLSFLPITCLLGFCTFPTSVTFTSKNSKLTSQALSQTRTPNLSLLSLWVGPYRCQFLCLDPCSSGMTPQCPSFSLKGWLTRRNGGPCSSSSFCWSTWWQWLGTWVFLALLSLTHDSTLPCTSSWPTFHCWTLPTSPIRCPRYWHICWCQWGPSPIGHALPRYSSTTF